MFGFFFGSWISLEFYGIALYAILFQLFPATKNSWLVAFLLTTPFYVTLALLLYNAPLPTDRHGYGYLVLSILVLPPIVGNVARGIGIYLQSKGLTRLKALFIETALILVFVVVLGSGILNELFKPFEYPEPELNSAPSQKEPTK